MSNRIIIADASCLIALSNIEELELLQAVYKEVIITPEVQAEFGNPIPKWIKIEEVADTKKTQLLELELDKGESSAIALAVENENSLLIIDERKGRLVAKRMGLLIIGTQGIIIKAKENGIIERLKPILEKLEKVRFRISPKLKKQILDKVGENG